MRMIDPDVDKEYDKYYLCYRYSAIFKLISIYKWAGIFTEIHSGMLNRYDTGDIKTVHDMDVPPFEHENVIYFKLDDEEEFKHIMMELITTNL